MSKDYELFISIFSSFKMLWKKALGRLRLLTCSISALGAKIRYKRSLFEKQTGLKYEQLKRDRGAYGEYRLYDKLRHYKGMWLFNVYLPHRDEKTEIDSIFISARGVFLFESKNFTGRIYGRASQREWFHTFRSEKRYGIKKQRFFNPLMQNGAHKNAFKALFKTNLPIYPIVVFGEKSELYTPEAKLRSSELMKIQKLRSFIGKCPKRAVSKDDIEALYRQIRPYTEIDGRQKYQHIQQVRKKNLHR